MQLSNWTKLFFWDKYLGGSNLLSSTFDSGTDVVLGIDVVVGDWINSTASSIFVISSEISDCEGSLLHKERVEEIKDIF